MTREEEIIENAWMYESVARDEFRGTVEAFKAGAHWADIHHQSPWVPIDGKHPLPDPGKTILLYYPDKIGKVELSKRIISENKHDEDGYDEYGFDVGIEVVNVAIFSTRKVRATYWMPIPEPNEEGGYNDPLWREALESVKKLRDILKDFNARNEEREPIEEAWNEND